MQSSDRQPFARWLDTTNDVLGRFLAAGQTPGLINLGGGLPDPALFPAEAMASIAAQVTRDHSAEALGYGPIHGLPRLRSLIAERIAVDGMVITPENVLITSGSTQALDLISKAFIDVGDQIAVQHPTYLGALDAFRPRGPKIRNIDLEDEGLDLNEALRGTKFAYTVPNFSNPTGKIVDQDQREQILEAAEHTGTWLVEDDPYGTLHLDSAPVPSMLSLSSVHQNGGSYQGACIFLGSLSKQLSPGLRVGWIVASTPVIEALAFAKQGADMCTSGLSQLIAFEAIRSGLVDSILPKKLETYRARRDALCDALSEHLGNLLEWERPSGGMFVWARAKDPRIDTDALVDYALREGVLISPSSVFDSRSEDHSAMRLNYTLNAPEDLRTAIQRLSVAMRSMIADHAPQRRLG